MKNLNVVNSIPLVVHPLKVVLRQTCYSKVPDPEIHNHITITLEG